MRTLAFLNQRQLSRGVVSVATRCAALTIVAIALSTLIWTQSAAAYPFWAQQTAPETPREATGRLACANCHLAEKPAEIEIPQSVLPDTVFEAVVKVPYDLEAQQIMADGSKGGLNVGAVLMLPDGFKIAPSDRIPEEMQEKIEGVFYTPYKDGEDNVVIVGPLPGDQYQEIVFPVLSPDPSTDKNIHFGKYAVHLGANRGRGQVYPTGETSNNNPITTTVAGTVSKISAAEAGGFDVTITSEDGSDTAVTIPAGLDLLVAKRQVVAAGDALTTDPNVGGFGQKDVEVVLQSSGRVLGLIVFIFGIMLAQALLILKKKQIERVQAAEMDF